MGNAFQKDYYESHYAVAQHRTREKLDHPLLAGFNDRIAEHVLDVAPDVGGRPLRLLEAGCGEGLMAASLARVARDRGVTLDYTGTDLTQSAADQASQVAPGRFLPADAGDLGAELDGSEFDLIFSKSLLHHMDEPARFTEGARRLLAPGGRVVVMEPTRLSPTAFVLAVAAPRREKLWFVGSRRRYLQAMARGGLRPEREDVFSFLPFELAFATRFSILRTLISVRRPRTLRAIHRWDRRLARWLRPFGNYWMWTLAPSRVPARGAESDPHAPSGWSSSQAGTG